MSQPRSYSVTSSARVGAPPSAVYEIIADYRRGHPRILPKQFTRLTVEQGGVGAGTVIRFGVRVLGRTQAFRAVVSEPEPGRILVERNTEPNESVTTFFVNPDSGGQAAHVTITTELRRKPGILGAVEQLISTRVLRSMYKEELRLLDDAARQPRP